MYIGKVPKVFFTLSPDWIEQQMLRFFSFTCCWMENRYLSKLFSQRGFQRVSVGNYGSRYVTCKITLDPHCTVGRYLLVFYKGMFYCSVVDPDPGSGVFWTPPPPGSGMEKNPDPWSGMNIPDQISESLETVFLDLNLWLRIRDLPRIRDSV